MPTPNEGKEVMAWLLMLGWRKLSLTPKSIPMTCRYFADNHLGRFAVQLGQYTMLLIVYDDHVTIPVTPALSKHIPADEALMHLHHGTFEQALIEVANEAEQKARMELFRTSVV